jgi:hypothetical protein
MCDKCVELDKKMERYRRVSSSLADQITIDRIKTLIDELQTQKVELHPEQKPSLWVGEHDGDPMVPRIGMMKASRAEAAPRRKRAKAYEPRRNKSPWWCLIPVLLRSLELSSHE